MIATLKYAVKTETKTFPIGTKVKTLAIKFGVDRVYKYLCEADGVQFEVEARLLEESKI